jgi:hypothetical protein
MNSTFHPWLAELRELARARGRRAWRYRWETLFQVLAWTALAAVLAWGWSHLDGDHAGVVLHVLLQQPLLPIGLSAVLGYGTASGIGRALVSEWREGWWGAMPVAPRASALTLRLVALFAALLMLLALAGLLLALAAVADHWRTWLVPALTCCAIGVPLGALPALWRSPRAWDAPAPRVQARAQDKPLFALPWLELPVLPHFAQWQRRENLRVWRHGGRVWPLLALGLLVPMGTRGWSLLGLLLFGLSLIWFGLVLRAALDVVARADALLRATPLSFTAFCKASLRYPLWAWLLASLWGGTGLLLQSARWPVALAYAAALFSALVLQLVLAWRFRRAPWRARLRAGVDASLILALLYFAPPLALLVAVALIVRHYQLARALP